MKICTDCRVNLVTVEVHMECEWCVWIGEKMSSKQLNRVL